MDKATVQHVEPAATKYARTLAMMMPLLEPNIGVMYMPVSQPYRLFDGRPIQQKCQSQRRASRSALQQLQIGGTLAPIILPLQEETLMWRIEWPSPDNRQLMVSEQSRSILSDVQQLGMRRQSQISARRRPATTPDKRGSHQLQGGGAVQQKTSLNKGLESRKVK